MGTPTKRYRLGFKFWLDMNNDDDVFIADQIERLKNKRRFTQTVREGILITTELQQGSRAAAAALYPNVITPPDNAAQVQALQEQVASEQQRTSQAEAEAERLRKENVALQQRIKELESRTSDKVHAKLELLEKMLTELQAGTQTAQKPFSGGLQPVAGAGSPKSLNAPQTLSAPNLPPPSFDDDDDADLLEVKESDGSNSNASMNFINSVKRLMGDDW